MPTQGSTDDFVPDNGADNDDDEEDDYIWMLSKINDWFYIQRNGLDITYWCYWCPVYMYWSYWYYELRYDGSYELVEHVW